VARCGRAGHIPSSVNVPTISLSKRGRG
jgi:3-mercaptopyruvate sulfurtransferase SseA